MTLEEILNKIYYKEHNYDGVDLLYKKAKVFDTTIKKSDVKTWLDKQLSKQLTANKTGKKEFLPIYSETPYSFQLDLTFFPRYKKQNDNNYVLFTAININTRFAYAYYSKDKEMHTILDMLKQMEKKTVINSLTCDEGTEFTNNEFVKYCDNHNIDLYFVKNDSHKLGIINRFHRTLKDKLKKHFIATDNLNWIDAIDKIIYNYNHTVNTGIGIEPSKVDAFIEHQIVTLKRDITTLMNSKEELFKVGDKVRILNKNVVFQDKLLPKYSSTVFIVDKVFNNACIVKHGDTEMRIKNSQLIKNNFVDNQKELINIPKLMNEHKSESNLKKEDLIDVKLPDKEKRNEKKIYVKVVKKDNSDIDFIKTYLIGKTFIDFDRKRSVIDGVIYSKTYKNYLVDYSHKGSDQQSYLYEVLQKSRREDWYIIHKDLFENVIKKYKL